VVVLLGDAITVFPIVVFNPALVGLQLYVPLPVAVNVTDAPCIIVALGLTLTDGGG